MFSRSTLLPLAALALSIAAQDAEPVCQAYGIDFQNGGEYFINTLSTAPFTCVTQFSGCQNDTASVLLIDPSGDEYECSDVPTPDNVNEMSTCPINKNQMTSGEWEILILGNNGPEATDEPFAFQRVFSIDAAPQQTMTVTPTVTYYQTITPTVHKTNTSTVYSTVTKSPTKTVVLPASTNVQTTTPKAVTTTAFKTVTKTSKKWTQTKTVITETQRPSCTVPHRAAHHDPICTVLPKGVKLPPGLNIPGLKHAKRDVAMDSAAVRARFEAVRARRAAGSPVEKEKRGAMVKRDADQPTVTVSLTSPIINTTVTYTTTPYTAYNLTITTKTTTKTLPVTTIHSGVKKTTVTAPTPTKTVYKVKYTATTVTKTLTATLTHHTVVAATGQVMECKKRGGHFGPFYHGWW